MSLAAFQLSYNGLVFGANQDVQLVQVAGLREAPPTRSGDVPRPRRHGSFAGRTFFGERIVNLTLGVSITQAGFEQTLEAMSAAFANIVEPSGLLPLQFMLPGWSTPRQVTGRVTKGGYPVDVDYSHGKIASLPVELTCPDPLIYDTAQQSVTAGLPSPTAGLGFPVAFPVSFGASSGGSLQLGNTGNEALSPVFTINGPITWPQLTIGSAFLAFQITLGAGDQLVVDCGAQTATLNGTASRLGTIVTGSTWLAVPPGGATVGFSSVDSTQVAGNVVAACSAGAWGWC